jgi:hypothetical protein
LSSGFLTEALYVFLLSSCMLYALHMSSWLDHSNYVLRSGQIIKFFILLFPPKCYNFISLRFNLISNSKRCTSNLILVHICLYLNRYLSILSKAAFSK